jgi:release factor glutamine methyltransferase
VLAVPKPTEDRPAASPTAVKFRQVELWFGPGVFHPQPETDRVVQAAVDHLARLIAGGVARPQVADLCTGCGTIAVSVAKEVPAASVHAVDLDPNAITWAAANADVNQVQVQLHRQDLTLALDGHGASFDVVVSNPPYVAAHELDGVAAAAYARDPLLALLAGDDGLDLIRAVEAAAARLLKPGGLVVVEHSDRQGESAPAVFDRSGRWERVADHVDDEGLDRFVTALRL